MIASQVGNWRLAVFGVVAIWLLGLAPAALAQRAGPVAWDPAVNLSDTPAESGAPAIVADPSGMVHVFWGENTDESLNYPNMIFYTRWDGQAWSRPHDILFSPESQRATASKPSAVVSLDGRIDLAWGGGWNGTIYFSSARADEAISAQAWRGPLPVSKSEVSADEPRLGLEANGRLHLVYVVPQGSEQGIYHTSTDDGGQSWSAPAAIPGSRQGSDRALIDPRLAVSPDGELHVAWAWVNLPEVFPPQGVLYSRSTDGGNTWSDPLVVAAGPYRNPQLATVGSSEVHLIWCGTNEDRHKFHQWSRDGGQTWSRPTHVLEIGGFQGYGGMAIDGAGRLHLALIGGSTDFGDVVYHLQWNGQSWGPPEVVLRNPSVVAQNPANAAIAIANGNEAHIVAEVPLPTTGNPPWQMDILQVGARLAAPSVAPQLLPTATPAPASSATPTAAPPPATALPTPAIASDGAGRGGASLIDLSGGDAGQVLVIGLLPLLALLAVVTTAQLRLRRRR